jgi:gliding motility-associated lipoprotein GldD
MRTSTYLLPFFLLVLACNSAYVQKPRGYYKIDFPQRAYKVYDEPGYPYTFEYPVYANVVKDSTFFDDKPEYWVNIDFPQFKGRVYIGYNGIGKVARFKVPDGKGGYKDSTGINTFERLREGSYKLTYKHTYKAASIEDSLMITPNGVMGVFFNVGGNAATAKQFFVSDTTRHFLRGTLYFDASPNEDSLGIVNQFLQEDMKHLINTLKWR